MRIISFIEDREVIQTILKHLGLWLVKSRPREEADLLQILAGYRNRLVHFYHEVSVEELYEICATS